jgi:hypothetical protein
MTVKSTTMNITLAITNYRANARLRRELLAKSQEKEARLNAIPTSHLPGIHTLPTELWSAIIDSLIKSSHTRKCQTYPDTCHLSQDLSLRSVCHTFNTETLHALHKHITLPHIPHASLVRDDPLHDHYVRNALLASALYNFHAIPTAARAGTTHALFFMNRIANCVRVAQHIDDLHTYAYASDLARVFCTAASTSRYCWSYMFDFPASGWHQWLDDRELEVALLVAGGYLRGNVGVWMRTLDMGREQEELQRLVALFET